MMICMVHGMMNDDKDPDLSFYFVHNVSAMCNVLHMQPAARSLVQSCNQKYVISLTIVKLKVPLKVKVKIKIKVKDKVRTWSGQVRSGQVSSGQIRSGQTQTPTPTKKWDLSYTLKLVFTTHHHPNHL